VKLRYSPFSGGFMQISINFRNIDSSDALKSYVQEKLDKLDKMFDSPAEAHVVLSVEKIRHIAEISLNCDRLKIHAKEETDSMYSAIDTLVDKVKLQVKKNKEKQRRHLSGDKQSIKNDYQDLDLSEGSSESLESDNLDV
jgi:putative sigma-54 modulation protein